MRLKAIYRFSLPMLAVFGLSNLAIAFWVYQKMNSPIEYKVNVIEAPKVVFPEVLTNSVNYSDRILPHRNRISGIVDDDSWIDNKPECWRMPYHYCVVGGRRVAYLNGVYCREGDKHAFGVISAIYPERIYFEGGNYIDNTQRRGLTDDNSRTVDSVSP